MTIYLDILLLSNLWVDYFLLQAVSRMTHTSLRRCRAVVAAAIGALSSLMIFLPPMPVVISWGSRALVALLLCCAAFGRCPVRQRFRQWLSLMLAAMIFCGVIYTIGNMITPNRLLHGNGVVYADVSLTVLLVGSVISAAVTTYTTRKKQLADRNRYRVCVVVEGTEYSMPAICDSGNSLHDPFSGLPAVLCSAKQLRPWIHDGDDITKAVSGQQSFRMLPVNTVTGSKLMPAFLPDALTIYDAHHSYPLRAMLAITEEDVPALFSPALLP